MKSPRQILVRGILLGVLAACLGAGTFFAYVAWYTGTDRFLPGVVLGSTPLGGMRPREARARLSGNLVRRPPVLAGGTGAAGGNPVGGRGTAMEPVSKPAPTTLQLRWGNRSWPLLLAEVGALPDVPEAMRTAAGIGRNGSLWQRSRAFLVGIVHGHYVPLEPAIKDQKITERLEAIAGEIDRPAEDAQYDFASDVVKAEIPGQVLDLEASLEAVRRAILAGKGEAGLVVRAVQPKVRSTDLASAKQYRIARFTTPILAADPGRVQNIALAIRKITGVVLQPGETFSFNDVVGPRDAANGWAQAKELYQGEFVLGYGGGICQVSSTLYNSVLLGGLEVKQRFHHDRPLQYVQPGRDATVAWNLLDFKFRNSLDVPVLIGGRLIPGRTQEIEITLHAPRPQPDNEIRVEEADVHYFPPPMVEVFDPTLPPGERRVEDEGHYGIEVKTFRVYGTGQHERRELVSHDRYQPKPGKVRVGVGHQPGAEKLVNPGLQ